jgi:hypothetical protein
MKRLLFAALILLLLCGCGKHEPLLPENSSPSISPTGQAKKGSLLPDYSNWGDGSLSSPRGVSINLFYDTDSGRKVFAVEPPVIDESIDAILRYQIDLDAFAAPEDAEVTFFVAVNGSLCNFSLGGESSSSGYLRKKASVNQVVEESLVITNCPLVSGQNQLSVVLFVYYPQIGRSVPGNLVVPFFSETERLGQSGLKKASHDNPSFVFHSPSEEDISFSRVGLLREQYSLKEDASGAAIIPPQDALWFRLNNRVEDEKKAGNECSVLVIAYVDGKPLPFRQDDFLFLSLSSEDVLIDLPLNFSRASGGLNLFNVMWCPIDLNVSAGFSDFLVYTE